MLASEFFVRELKTHELKLAVILLPTSDFLKYIYIL